MSIYTVEDRATGEVVHAYSADAPDHTDTYPFGTYNHILQKPVATVAPSRRVSRLQFVARLGDAAFIALLTMAKQSVEVEAMMKLVEWATPDPDGTSIDLDDPRLQKLYEVEPALIAQGAASSGWADGVLA